MSSTRPALPQARTAHASSMGTPMSTDVHIAVRHKLGNGSAAALVHFAKLARLPGNARVVKHICHIAQRLGAGVVRAALAARPYILSGTHHSSCGRHCAGRALGERGVQRCVHICRHAHRTAQHLFIICPLRTRQLFQEVEGVIALQAVVPSEPTSSLSVSTQGGECGRLRVDFGAKGRVCAYTVIMPIGANHAAVKAYIRRLERRHRFNFSACEIALCNAIALVQKLHGIQLDALFRLFVRIGNAAHHNVQLFPLQAFAKGCACSGLH